MLEQKIEALTAAIEALTAKLDAAPVPTEKPKAKAKAKSEPKPEPKPEPDAEPAMSVGDVTEAALAAVRKGHSDEIKAKLAELGATRITNLEPGPLAVFAAWVVSLGQ